MPNTFQRIPADYSQKVASGVQRAKDWVRTPGYRTVPKADLPINYYTDRRSALSVSYWAGTREYNSVTGVTTNSNPPQYPVSLSSAEDYISQVYNAWFADPFENASGKLSSAANSALVKALGRASDAKVNLAVSLAEASKTSDMIYDTAKRVSKAMTAVRRGNFREVARQLNLPPNTAHKNWLAYKYGWTPLLMEVKGAAEFFAQQHISRPVRFVVTAKEVSNFNWKRSVPYVPYGGSTPSYAYVETLTGKITHKRKMWLEVTSPTASAVQQLGITNPMLVAWELVPYSFVFDWFCQVGDYLQGLTALQGLTVRKAMFSNLTEFDLSRSMPATSAVQGNWQYINNPWNVKSVLRQYGRSSFVPLPTDIYPPKGDGISSFAKLVTGLALIRGNQRGSSNRI